MTQPWHSVGEVDADGLCTGCGFCSAVCPAACVALKESAAGFLRAAVDNEACLSCGACMKVCPGAGLAPGTFSARVDPFMGQVVAAYVVQATDRRLLMNAQSGGAVTAVLGHLLRSGQVDVAVVAAMPEDGSLRPAPVRVRDPHMLGRSQGSKYCPLPMGCGLSGTGNGSGERVAFVGLGCHIQALRNAQARNVRLADEASIAIGLVCAGIASFDAMDHLVGKTGMMRKEVRTFRYRSKRKHGWPGWVRVTGKDGEDRYLPPEDRLNTWDGYRAHRCMLCFDKMNSLADLVAGDAWGVRSDKIGCSVVLARTRLGLDALLSAKRSGVISLEPLEAEVVFRGQGIERKRREWTAYTEAWRRMGMTSPYYGIADEWRATPHRGTARRTSVDLTRAYRRSNSGSKRQAHRMAQKHIRVAQLRRLIAPRRYLKRLTAKVTSPPQAKEIGVVKRIVLVGSHLTGNLGGPSMILGITNVMSRLFPDVRYTLVGYPGDAEREAATAARYGFAFVPGRSFDKRLLKWALLWRLFGQLPRGGTPPERELFEAFYSADLVIEDSGIAFADTLGSNRFYDRMYNGSLYLLGKLLGKPVVKYTGAIGPLEQKWNRLAAKFYLGRCCDLILARDDESRDWVSSLGIRTPVGVCPDTGFLLGVSETETSLRLRLLKQKHPVVGLSISFQARNRAPSHEAYLDTMASLVHHLVEHYSAYVFLLPNDHGNKDNDLKIGDEIQRRSACPQCEVIQTREMLGEEVKGIVAEFDACVAARYHTIIACLSSAVPVLSIGWHHKYAAVLKLCDMAGFLVNVSDLDLAKLTSLFERLWHGRAEIRERLGKRLEDVKSGIQAGAVKVHDLMKRRCLC